MNKNVMLKTIKEALVKHEKNEDSFSNSEYTIGWIGSIIDIEIENEKSRGRYKY